MKTFFENYYRDLKGIINSYDNEDGIITESWKPHLDNLPEMYWFFYNIAISGKIDDSSLKKIYVTLEYLICPLDFMPELIYGPDGLKEDTYFLALTLKDIGPKIKNDLIDEHWKIKTSYIKCADEIITLACKELPENILKSVNAFYKEYESQITCDEIKNILTSNEKCDDIKSKPEKKSNLESDNKEDAIRHIDGPCIVFAGPGSGKTFTIEERVAHMINNANINPGNILVTTFTNKAADELVVRLRDRFSDRKDVDKIMSALTISTIHSFCFSLLKKYQHRILFLKETYTPVEQGDQMLFIYRHSGEKYLNIKHLFQYWKNSRLKAGEQFYNLNLFDFYMDILQIYNFLSEEILGSNQKTQLEYFKIIKSNKPRCFEDSIIATYPKYWQLLLDNGFMDQSIVLSYTEALLKYDQILNEVRKKYRYLMIDEYQDTNPVQDRIFRQISGENGNLFVVGDDDQSIYRFRGAEVSNITDFTKRFQQALTVRLNENRRSSKKIVEATKSLIEHNKIRVSKSLYSNHEEGKPVSLVICENDKDQAEKAIEIIQNLRKSHAIESLSQVAILFRSVKTPGPKFKKALKEKGIECKVSSDKSFFKIDEIKGILQVFEFLAQEKLAINSKKRNYPLFFKKAGIEDKNEMNEKIKEWHKNLYSGKFNSLLTFYYSILHDAGILKSQDEDESCMGNLGMLSEIIACFEGGQGGTELKDNLTFLLQYCEMLEGSVDQADMETGDAVTLMTIHKSKGLQFDYVIIANVIEGQFPMSYRSGPRQRTKGVILYGPEGRNHDDNESKRSLEEERRVFYVGLTRAAKGIFLLTEKGKESEFIKELGAKNIVKQETVAPAIPRRIKSSSGDVLRVSHSEIYDYRFCPGRYNYTNRYKFKGQAIQPLFSGLSLHRSLEVLHRMIIDKQRVDKDIVNRIFDRCWISPSANDENEKKRIANIFYNYSDKILTRKGKTRILEAELPFMTANGNNVLNGKLDLVEENEEGQIEIIEFKFSRNGLLEDYTANQLNHYSLAYPQQDILLSAYYLKEQKKETIEKKDRIDRKTIKYQLEEDFRKIRNKEFERKPSKARCKICPVAIVCGENNPN